MPKQRKTDKYRLLENRGTGRGTEYKPFYQVHEFGSRGRVHRILGWLNRRVYHLMSDLELYFFLITQWQLENVVDIREQFPLLPLEETQSIAEEENIKHPPRSRKQKSIMTTDLLITVKNGNTYKDIARAIKTQKDMEKERTKEKLKIEELYWSKKNIDWDVINETQISKVMGRNLHFIYDRYFWQEQNGFDQETTKSLVYDFIDDLIKNNHDILKTTNETDIKRYWDIGESLNFFQFLLARRIIDTDFNTRLNYHSMDIQINHERRWKLE